MYSAVFRVIVAALLVITFTAAAWAEVVMVPMNDGARLATEYVLPAGDGPFPVVLVRSVYGRDKSMAGLFNAQGLAYVVQDTRGRGDSEGKDWVFRDDGWGEHRDGAETVAWVKAQPWCNGTIGTFGMSALGITQVLMAGATQDIKAQGIWVAASNFYGQLSYQGGVWRKSLCEWWVQGQRSEHVIELWKSHPAYDAFWEGFNAEARAPEITAAGIHVGGWWDIFAQGTINSFVTRHYDGGDGAKGNQMLVMGPWLHGPVPQPGDLTLPKNFTMDFAGLTARFLAHHLTGASNGIESAPAVHYYTLGDVDDPESPGNEWRTANDWPPFDTLETPYYLAPDGVLETTTPDTAGAVTYAYDPNDPCPTMGGPNLFADRLPTGPVDQRKLEGRNDVIKFFTPVLEEPVEITGRVKAVLYISSDAPDTDFACKLIDVYPDGREIAMLDGIQRAKYRNGFTEAELLEDGKTVKLEVDLWSISLIVNKGHRIGLQISSSNYPRFEKNPNTGDDFPDDVEPRTANNTVHTGGATPSALVLPVRPGSI